MKENPFISDTFSAIWLKHFNPEGDAYSFPFLPGLKFIRHPRFNYYINAGQTHTKGVDFTLSREYDEALEGKTLLIYDVPSYFEQAGHLPAASGRLGCRRVRQYPGFLIDLSGFSDLNAYMAGTFGRKSRNKLRRDRRRLEASFDMEYKVFCGAITAEEHETLFGVFRNLLEKRYDEKGESNNNLDPEEWNFYKEVSYPMILEERAALLVIYAQGHPVGIMLNYLSEDTLFQAITVFDIDYSHFNVGTTGFLELIEWCLGRNIKILDFSKGYYPYKAAWSTRSYVFEYHILYDRKSLKARATALGLAGFFRLKQGMRALKLNTLLHRLTYRLKGRDHALSAATYSYEELQVKPASAELVQLDPEDPEHAFLKRGLMDFLYFNHEHYANVRLYRVAHSPNRFLIEGLNTLQNMTVKVA